jgi:hypothetical protein
MGVGIALGVALGIALDNLALGLSLGVAFLSGETLVIARRLSWDRESWKQIVVDQGPRYLPHRESHHHALPHRR